jgi:V/A-type H+-transporting ATPase subunit E|tara:strand:+ start:8333 stop:8941 length:609 start_codon:yes stop_codon:yes gene_type:complete
LNNREAFENVVSKVVNDITKEIMSSLENSHNDALKIIENAEQESDINAAEILQSVDKEGDTLRRRIIGNTELKARNKSLQLIEETVNKIFAESLKGLNDISSNKNYDKSIKRHLEEGLDAIGGEKFTVSCDTKDVDLLNKISKEVQETRGVKIKLSSKSISCNGGVKIMNHDGSVIFNNTVEARLERFKPLLRKQISDMLTK